MGRRREPRVEMVLPAKLWTDREGPPFGQDCLTHDITRHGVCLEGVPSLKVGQVITLAYHQKKSCFRVAWVGKTGSAQAGRAGLENLEPEKLIFGVGFPDSHDDYRGPTAAASAAVKIATAPAWDGKERRAHQRYPCAGEVEIREEGGETTTSGKLADISLGGCYVEMMTPFPVGSSLQLVLTVAEMKIRLKGIVRVGQRDGMGIQISEIAAEERTRVEQLLNWLAQGGVGSPAPVSKPAPASAGRVAVANGSDPVAVLNSLLKWFSSRNTLNRDEFLSMLRRSRNPKQPAAEAPKT